MHRLEHCDDDMTLENIILRHVGTRQGSSAFFENDAGGHIAAFLRRNKNWEERGKLININ